MARVTLIGEGDRTELADLIRTIKAERGGKLLNLYKALLNSPPIAEGWLNLFTAIRQKGRLAAPLRELAILRVALLNGAEYEYQAHIPHALHSGVTQAQLDGLPQWRESAAFSPVERAVLACTDAMTRDIKVPDALFQELRTHFDERELVELCATVGGYNLVSRFLVAMQIDPERG